jgi:hypothetical protein
MSKTIGHGTSISYTTGGDYHPIGYVRSIDGPSVAGDEVEATTLDTTGNYREYIPTLIDPGELSLELVWDPSFETTGVTAENTQIRLTDMMSSRETVDWKMVFPTTTMTVSFSGWVKAFSPSTPVDDLVTANVTIRATSAVTWPTS